jgi:broad specificity phosphatase PhoE
MMFVVRHAERHDRSTPDGWSELALRPQDTPLSQRGLRQSRRLGKWFYGKLPIHRPLAIFASPFIRCIQTADAIAVELEGLQRAGVFGKDNHSIKICVEPGLVEDMRYMGGLKHREPWYLKAADLICISPRVDLTYQPLRDVQFQRGPTYPGPCVEVGDPVHRLNTIAHEIAQHPLVAAGGTAIAVTHGKPSADLIRSLQPAPNGIALPSYERIKAGKYDGPPLHYTAVTALQRDDDDDSWDLAPGFELFSNSHDPRLVALRQNDADRATRYVVGEPAKAPRYVVGETNLTTGGPVLKGKWRPCGAIELEAIELRSAHVEAGQRVTVTGPDGGEAVSITLPQEYRPGDVVRVRLIGDACRTENEETEKVLAKRFGGGMMYGSSCTPPTNAVDDEKDAKKLDKAVEASQKTEEVAAAKAVA